MSLVWSNRTTDANKPIIEMSICFCQAIESAAGRNCDNGPPINGHDLAKKWANGDSRIEYIPPVLDLLAGGIGWRPDSEWKLVETIESLTSEGKKKSKTRPFSIDKCTDKKAGLLRHGYQQGHTVT